MNLDHDVYVKSFEFRPDNRKVVHHAIVFSDPNGARSQTGPQRKQLSLFRRSRLWARPVWWPDGLRAGRPAFAGKGMELTVAKGTDLVLQIHYHPSGKAEQDQSSLGMTFGEAPTIGRGLVFHQFAGDSHSRRRIALRGEDGHHDSAGRGGAGDHAARALSGQGHEDRRASAGWFRHST